MDVKDVVFIVGVMGGICVLMGFLLYASHKEVIPICEQRNKWQKLCWENDERIKEIRDAWARDIQQKDREISCLRIHLASERSKS